MITTKCLRNSACLMHLIKYINLKCFFNSCKPYLKFYSTSSNYNIDLKIQGKSLNTYILKLQQEYDALCQDNTSSMSRRIEIQPIIQILEDRKNLVGNIASLEELLLEKDDDLRKLAEEEKRLFEIKLKEIDERLLDALIPIDKEISFDSIILEVQAGVGGQEAMLFAKDIFEMYCSFSQYKGWEIQTAEYLSADTGGIRSATALIRGLSVFQYLRHEAGIHRVQRIPSTEKAGRIHTSTISVIAMPQPSEIDIYIDPNDLKIETKRSSGAGGQHVNKTESAVRIVHLPTGVAVECQEDRSQIKNRKIAMARLSAILYQKKLDEQIKETEATKKNQVKTRNRNEKIRTYNYKDGRITDHRIGANIYNLEVFLKGGEPLDKLIQQLDEFYRLESLLNVVSNTV